jgi:hypothetical protein
MHYHINTYNYPCSHTHKINDTIALNGASHTNHTPILNYGLLEPNSNVGNFSCEFTKNEQFGSKVKRPIGWV